MAPKTRRPRRRAALVLLSLLALVAVSAAPATAARPTPQPPAPTTVTWSGVTWSIKTSSRPVGPGPNVFAASNVSVDAAGALHLRIAKAKGKWTTAEIVGPTSLGYGTYTFTVGSRVDNLDRNAVLGLFTWSDDPAYAHREIDIEFARWGNATDPTSGQYVVQPYDLANHMVRFVQPPSAVSTHSFTWRPGRIDWLSTDASGQIASYTYTGADVPVPGDERVRLNLWLFQGRAPSNGLPVEVVVNAFAYAPLAP